MRKKKQTHLYLTKGEKAMLKLYEAQEEARNQVSHKNYRIGKRRK